MQYKVESELLGPLFMGVSVSSDSEPRREYYLNFRGPGYNEDQYPVFKLNGIEYKFETFGIRQTVLNGTWLQPQIDYNRVKRVEGGDMTSKAQSDVYGHMRDLWNRFRKDNPSWINEVEREHMENKIDRIDKALTEKALEIEELHKTQSALREKLALMP